jgi:hypothetical protein
VPRLRRRLGDAAVDRILVANPARLFALPGTGTGSDATRGTGGRPRAPG